MKRFIQRKYERIDIPEGITGTPVAEFFGDNVTLPPSLAGALVYEINGRRIIARQGDL